MEDFSRIVHTASSVTLLGGGAARESDLRESLDFAPLLVCADGGANHAAEWGIRPAGIIGDMDSFSDGLRMGIGAPLAGVPVLELTDQNTTDFEKCLSVVRAPLVIGVGFLGKRLDHQLAVLNGLCKHADRKIVLIGAEDIVFRAPPVLSVDLPAGTRVSLHPLTGSQARSTGLRWPVEGLDFQPDGQIGSSNAATGGEMRLETLGGHLLVMLPRLFLGAVIGALQAD
ncbi:thiamine diphosphokinase [Neptunicoccus cionae]|uniref:thiamine diphosphokinase n=1 Tax=Neptunicoccus cionae TaxID=2035344 RepID=UPI00256FB05D|nr:thiamine diphosphokinase [Amylibacter cionae]